MAAAATASSPTPSPASPTPSPTPSVTEGDATPTPAPPPGKGWKRMMRGPFGAIHGEFVVPDGNGGYQTVATQIGEVTEVGEDSVTVRSEDGFSRTYAVGDSTRVSAGRQGVTGIESGDTVAVTAEVEGQTATATSVVDLTRPQHPRWYGGHGRDFPGKPFPGREGDPAPGGLPGAHRLTAGFPPPPADGAPARQRGERPRPSAGRTRRAPYAPGTASVHRVRAPHSPTRSGRQPKTVNMIRFEPRRFEPRRFDPRRFEPRRFDPRRFEPRRFVEAVSAFLERDRFRDSIGMS
nr:hypothetical protein GCM10020093_017060 [Planobispora longispora]